MTMSPPTTTATTSPAMSDTERAKNTLRQKLPARPPPFAADLLSPPTSVVVGEAAPRPPFPESEASSARPQWSPVRQALQDRINGLPLVRSLRHHPQDFHEFDPYWPVDGHALEHHLTMTTLSGQTELPVEPITFRHTKAYDPFTVAASTPLTEEPGSAETTKPYSASLVPRRLAINEVIFNNQTDDVMTQIQYLGRSLCGHDGIIHGGLLATIVDEAFARLAFAFLPGHSGFTANLNVDYRSPVPADIMVVLVISIDRVDGRKVFLKARMSSLDGKFTFLESTSLYIAPRPKGGDAEKSANVNEKKTAPSSSS